MEVAGCSGDKLDAAESAAVERLSSKNLLLAVALWSKLRSEIEFSFDAKLSTRILSTLGECVKSITSTAGNRKGNYLICS